MRFSRISAEVCTKNSGCADCGHPGRLAAQAAESGTTVEELEAGLAANSIRRVIDAREVADVVTFLASPRSIAITGDAIAAGGGVPGPVYY